MIGAMTHPDYRQRPTVAQILSQKWVSEELLAQRMTIVTRELTKTSDNKERSEKSIMDSLNNEYGIINTK